MMATQLGAGQDESEEKVDGCRCGREKDICASVCRRHVSGVYPPTHPSHSPMLTVNCPFLLMNSCHAPPQTRARVSVSRDDSSGRLDIEQVFVHITLCLLRNP